MSWQGTCCISYWDTRTFSIFQRAFLKSFFKRELQQWECRVTYCMFKSYRLTGFSTLAYLLRYLSPILTWRKEQKHDVNFGLYWSFVFKSCNIKALSCQFLPNMENKLSKWLQKLRIWFSKALTCLTLFCLFVCLKRMLKLVSACWDQLNLSMLGI